MKQDVSGISDNPFAVSQISASTLTPQSATNLFDCYDLLIQYTEESFLILDTDLRIINFSHNFQKQYESFIGREITKGTNILDYSPLQRAENSKKKYQRALQGETFEVELEIPVGHNTTYSCLNKYKPIYSDTRQIIGIFITSTNITPTKNAQLEIRKHEDRYRSIIENTLDAFFFCHSDGSILDANNAATEMFGYDLDELKQLNRTDIIDHSDPQFIGYLQEKLKTRKLKGEATGIRKNGEKFPLEFSSILYTDTDTQTKVGTFISDISARKQAEKTLELSEKRFRALIENTNDIILLTDEKGAVKYASPAFERVTGFTLEEVRQNQGLIMAQLHPDYTEVVKETYYKALATPEVPIYRLIQYRHKAGYYVWLEGVITNFLHDVNIAGVLSNYRDISRSKTAEARVTKGEKRFQALVENAGDIIILSNAKGIISYVSPAFEKLTGYKAAEVVGHINLNFMHPENAGETFGLFTKSLENPGVSIPRTNRLKCKDGSYIWVEGFLTNLLHDENVHAVVSNYRDISGLLQATELMRQSETNLKTIFENASEAFLLADNNRIVKAFNSNARKVAFLNQSKELKCGFDVLDFIAESRADIMKAMFDRVLSGEFLQYDRYYKQENGDSSWVNFSIRPVIENNRITGMCVTGRDITERKKAEEELIKRELRFRTILKNSHDMLFLFDVDGKIEFLSPAIEKLFGYSNHEDEIQYILDSIHPDDFENAMQQLRLAFHSPDVPVFVTLRKQKKDGTYVWLEGTLTNMLHIPEVNVVVANFRDITERKLFEEQQALFVSIVNSSEDAILSIGTDDTIMTWNKAAEKIFGYTAEEIIGQNNNRLIPPSRLEEDNNIIQNIRKGASEKHYETKRVHKNGTQIDVSLTISPIRDTKGNITGASKIARDISDKKRAEDIIKNNEKRFRSLLQNSKDGLSLMSVDGVMIEISPTGKEITGFVENEMVGHTRFDLIHPDDLEKVTKAFTDVIEDPQKTANFEYRSLTKNGTYQWLEACCTNLLHEPAVEAIVINYRDITERKSQELEREKLIKTLHQNNNDLRNFSYITSHNLRAPLSNLMGFIDLLDDIPIEDPTLSTIIEGFKVSTIQLNQTINDLVRILIIRENEHIEQNDVLFSQILTQVKGQLRTMIDEVQPIIKADFHEAPTVSFNGTYLESILLNLLSNAIRYRSYDRPLQIHIKTQKNHNAIILTFTDNGIGFDAERHKSKIFGLYQRFHDRPNSKGLGLYLVKSQMESLQGSIEVESQVDVGTTFILRFQAHP